MLVLVLTTPLLAAVRVDAGAGADLLAGATLPSGGDVQTVAGLRQVEGDLQVGVDAIRFRLDLDAGVVLEGGGPVLYGIAPEVAEVTADTGPAWLAAGIAPGPWRVEGVDAWDTRLVTFSTVATATPGEILGLTVGFGSEPDGVALVGGLQAATSVPFGGPLAAWEAGTAPIVGVHARTHGRSFQVGGGAFVRPIAPFSGGAELGGRVTLGVVELQADLLGGIGWTNAAYLQAAFVPEAAVSPAVRVEWAGSPGGALGVRWRPARWAFLRFEAGYARGAPEGYAEFAMFSPWPPREERGAKRPKRR
jgi:hypothetical protein